MKMKWSIHDDVRNPSRPRMKDYSDRDRSSQDVELALGLLPSHACFHHLGVVHDS